jgi:hypothetical protein
MWIMIIKKLACEVSPPKLSIFWSAPWPDDKYAPKQVEHFIADSAWEDFDENFDKDENEDQLSPRQLRQKAEAYLATQTFGYERGLFGSENNWVGARRVHYKGKDVRVFPDEFSVLKHENMAMYLGLLDPGHEEASHELVSESVAETKLMDDVFKGAAKDVYDAALVDGCTPVQASAMALGIDISEPVQAASFPAIGWYRCKREYALMWCNESEIAE